MQGVSTCQSEKAAVARTAIVPSLRTDWKDFRDLSLFFILPHNYEIRPHYYQTKCLIFLSSECKALPYIFSGDLEKQLLVVEP